MATQYKVGDEVEVIRGPIHFSTNEEGGLIGHEYADDSIGQQGIIINAHKTQKIDHYSLHYPNGFKGKMAWFHNKDLKLI